MAAIGPVSQVSRRDARIGAAWRRRPPGRARRRPRSGRRRRARGCSPTIAAKQLAPRCCGAEPRARLSDCARPAGPSATCARTDHSRASYPTRWWRRGRRGRDRLPRRSQRARYHDGRLGYQGRYEGEGRFFLLEQRGHPRDSDTPTSALRDGGLTGWRRRTFDRRRVVRRSGRARQRRRAPAGRFVRSRTRVGAVQGNRRLRRAELRRGAPGPRSTTRRETFTSRRPRDRDSYARPACERIGYVAVGTVGAEVRSVVRSSGNGARGGRAPDRQESHGEGRRSAGARPGRRGAEARGDRRDGGRELIDAHMAGRRPLRDAGCSPSSPTATSGHSRGRSRSRIRRRRLALRHARRPDLSPSRVRASADPTYECRPTAARRTKAARRHARGRRHGR